MIDRRVRKTDQAIREAFLRLLFSVRYDSITMSGIAAAADVSRSTLYHHYKMREQILEATMAFLIDELADALTGSGDPTALDKALDHFWENRRLARSIFGPPVNSLVCRWLTEAVEQRLMLAGAPRADARIAALTAAAGAIALLEQWLTGHVDVPRSRIASAMTAKVKP